jgi:nucleoside-diphosphate-sugar epimerase
MASVFIAGAAGLIGESIAIAFRNAGYRVYGLVRKEIQAQILSVLEILPVQGDINKVDTYEEVLKKASVVVDATGTNTTLLTAVIELNKNRIRSQKQIYIATSGILQFKETEDIVTERSELDRGVDLFNLQERNAADMLALTSEHIRGNIVRPGAVFGAGVNDHTLWNGSAKSLVEGFFGVDPEEEITFWGKHDKIWGWIHSYDLANIYVRIAETEQEHQDFIGTTELIEFDKIKLAAAKVAGWKGAVRYNKVIPADRVYDIFTNKNVKAVADKARRILNWTPKRVNMLQELDIFYNAWKANKALNKKLNQ